MAQAQHASVHIMTVVESQVAYPEPCARFEASVRRLDAGKGDPTLVFLSFWGGSSRTWAPVMEGLSATNRCVAIDYRGWGQSSKEATNYNLETLADGVVGIIGELGLKNYIIVGHSMGGKIAQLIAARHPTGLKQLILIAPAPPSALEVPKEVRQKMVESYQGREGVMGIISALPLTNDRRELIVEEILRGSPGAKRAWPEQGMIEDISAKASKITVPVHIIVGSADVVETEASLRRAFGKVIPSAKFTVLPGASHMAPLEATAEVVNAIRAAQSD